MTDWNILLEPAQNGQMTATVLELPTFQVTAGSRQLALEQIQTLLAQRLSEVEMVSISIPTESEDEREDNPWDEFGGVFSGNAEFESIVSDMRAERESDL